MTPPAELLEPLFQRLLTSNPFIDNRVTGFGPEDVDVADIHAAEFARLQELAREARTMRRGVGVLLWGEAGIGKSHLLARLLRWGDVERQAYSIFLPNLQASPANLPRAILKSVVITLTRGQTRRFTQTPLFEMVLSFIRAGLGDPASGNTPWPILERAYFAAIDRLSAKDPSRAALLDRTTFEILYTFFRCAYRAATGRSADDKPARYAVRWLAGESLDPHEAAALGLPRPSADEPTALIDGQQIKQVLVCLGWLALSAQRPLILCFDQVDNLDHDQAASLARFMEALIDGVPNLLLVTAGIQASLLQWRETRLIQDSAWDRIAQFEIYPQRLTAQQARRIVAARLATFRHGFEQNDLIRTYLDRDPFFPLRSTWADDFLGRRIDFRPREILTGAREVWLREQDALRRLGGLAWLDQWGTTPVIPDPSPPPEEPLEDVIDRRLAEIITEFCQAARLKPNSLRSDSDILADVLGALLTQQDDLQVDSPFTGKPGMTAPYHLQVARTEPGGEFAGRTWIRFLSAPGANSTAVALRQIVQAENPPERVLLVTEERSPLALGNSAESKCQKYLEDLQERGADYCQRIELTFDQFAYLSALQNMVRQARSGNLEITLSDGGSHGLSAEEVIASHRRQSRYHKAAILHDFLVQPVGA